MTDYVSSDTRRTDAINALRAAMALNAKMAADYTNQAKQTGIADSVRDLLKAGVDQLNTQNDLLNQSIQDQIYLFDLDDWSDACAKIDDENAKAIAKHAAARAEFDIKLRAIALNGGPMPTLEPFPTPLPRPMMPIRIRPRASTTIKN
jgi:hypothetical protein